MHIHNNGISNNTGASSKQKPADEGGRPLSGSPGASSSEDSVELSPQAQTLKQLESKIIASADIDRAKVDSIRQAIADGSYTINSDNIADKMLAVDNE